MNADPNLALIQAACDGDAEAVERLLGETRPSMLRFAYRYCAAADIEDAVQETLWTLYQRIGYLRTAQAFISWTFQIVRHECYRLLKRQSGRIEVDLWDCVDLSSEDETVLNEMQQDVLSALQRMPMAYRQVLILRDLEGCSAPETAKLLGMTVETVKSRLHRGRALLREQLAPWATA